MRQKGQNSFTTGGGGGGFFEKGNSSHDRSITYRAAENTFYMGFGGVENDSDRCGSATGPTEKNRTRGGGLKKIPPPPRVKKNDFFLFKKSIPDQNEFDSVPSYVEFEGGFSI